MGFLCGIILKFCRGVTAVNNISDKMLISVKFWHYLVIIITLPLVLTCNTQSKEKSTPEKYGKTNKIFLGYKLGMSKEEFYDHSWKLNDKGLVRQGPSNQSVYYELDDELDHPAQMYFYPSFHNDRVYQMRVKFQYSNWAPWNKNLYSDSLQVEVLKLFRKWYGKGFARRKTKRSRRNKVVYVKRDNNRRIVVASKGSRNVVAFITDIVAQKEAAKEKDEENKSD